MHFYKTTVLILYLLNEVYSFNILAIFPYQGKSHFFVFQPFLRELARRGHNMTVISHFPQTEPLKNYTDISLAGRTKILESALQLDLEPTFWSVIDIMHFILGVGSVNCKTLLEADNVQNLWKHPQKFDLVIVEQFNSDCALGLAYKMGAPVVAVTSHSPMPWHYARYGMPYNPAYMSFQILGGATKGTLRQRIERMTLYIYFNIYFKYVTQRADQKTIAQYLEDVPPLDELSKKVKFYLSYTHYALFGSQVRPANVIEVNGYHISKPKELPKDLKKYIDESEHGVIYVSFGSMLQANTMPRDKLDAIIAALSELPQRVIWKWDESSLPGNPKNVLVSQWLPQNDIFAHPKVVAFYSHCGLLGTTEAIYHGIPMVGMPIFGDQPSNAAAIEESGLGVQIQINELTKETLLQKFKTVLDPKFRKQVKELSKAWHDRPLSPMDTAVYWTEYAARTKNFTFRTAAADVPFYQYAYLDVIAVLATILVAIYLVLKSLVSLLFGKSETPSKKKAKRS